MVGNGDNEIIVSPNIHEFLVWPHLYRHFSIFLLFFAFFCFFLLFDFRMKQLRFRG